MKKGVLVVFIVGICVLFFGSVLAADVTNLTGQQQAQKCLNDSLVAMNDFARYNLPSARFNDTYNTAINIYSAQLIVSAKQGGNPDYSGVLDLCKQIIDLKSVAVNAADNYKVLLLFYNETITPDMNASTVNSLISRINEELQAQRYENVQPLIDQTYQEISSIKSEQTSLVLAYQSTTRNLQTFLTSNAILLISVVVLLIIAYILYRTRFAIWLAKRKLASLNLRKETLKKLMEQTQRDYFQTGKMSDGIYRIRIKNFGELVRDIDRQIPMVQQELMKLHANAIDLSKQKKR